jgi:hypothetical protein
VDMKRAVLALVVLSAILVMPSCSGRPSSKSVAEKNVQPAGNGTRTTSEPKVQPEQTERAEQIRRIWRRSHLKYRFENDELDLKNAKLESELAELKGRPQRLTSEGLARVRILSDTLAMRTDDRLDETDRNLEVSGDQPILSARIAQFRVEIDEICDQWDTKIRSAKTLPEANRLSSSMTKALQQKVGTLVEWMNAGIVEMRQHQSKLKQTDGTATSK